MGKNQTSNDNTTVTMCMSWHIPLPSRPFGRLSALSRVNSDLSYHTSLLWPETVNYMRDYLGGCSIFWNRDRVFKDVPEFSSVDEPTASVPAMKPFSIAAMTSSSEPPIL